MPDSQSAPRRVVILGADQMGRAIADTLASDERYRPVLSDTDESALVVAADAGIETLHVDGQFRESVRRALAGAAAVVCADTKFHLPDIVAIAQAGDCHYVDISENPSSAREVAAVATDATCVVPACGLSPGYVTALAAAMLEDSDLETGLDVRVGVLPARRANRLGYGLMWSIGGLIAEYTSPCLAVRGGHVVELNPLRETEQLSLDGERFEAFTTAGSLDGLVHRHDGRVGELVFKTLRYPGHLDYVRFLLDDLGLSGRLYQFRNLLMNGLPPVDEDRVIISMSLRRGPDTEPVSFLQEIRAERDATGSFQSAISIATAAHAACVVDIVCSGLAPHRGLLDHGELTLDLLRQSPYFAPLSAGPETLANRPDTRIHEGKQALQE